VNKISLCVTLQTQKACLLIPCTSVECSENIPMIKAVWHIL
jgi:hypothetical protein